MSSEEAEFAEFSALFERMIQRGEGLSRFLPLMLALAVEVDENGEPTDQTAGQREIVVDAANRRVVMIRSALGEFLNGEFSEKQGRSPASKSAVESMPRVVIGKDEVKGGSCPVCLEEWLEGDVAAEMPCKHRFHSKCVEEWLGRHATCPLCRYEMPVEEVEEEKKVGVWVGFAVSAGERRNEGEGDGGRSGGDSNSRDETEA
ncbi:RING-type domain-containing protein [Hirschfeldia incana]|nr:RING-type domain-containing protein [Hirschfeldia incana]